MLPKKKSRRLTIDGQVFRYAVSCSASGDGWYDFNVTVQNEQHNGSKLQAIGLVTRDYWLDFSHGDLDLDNYPVITPKHIETFVRRAQSEGWDFSTSGSSFELKVDNERDLRANPRS